MGPTSTQDRCIDLETPVNSHSGRLATGGGAFQTMGRMSSGVEQGREVVRSLGTSRIQAFRPRLPDASVSVRLHELLEGDAERLRRTYRFLWQLHDHARRRRHEPDAADGLAALAERMELPLVFEDVSALGLGLQRSDASPRLRKAYHDLRGGGLFALLVHLDLVLQGRGEPQDVARIALLARDHLKIMRNAVPDLDPTLYAADLENRAHPVALLREKWSSVRYQFAGREIDVELDCPLEGSIAACCMEFSTLDRILYNLVNNAAEHADDGRVRLVVLPLPECEGAIVRMAVLNRLGPRQHELLQRRFGREPSTLFQGGFSSHGMGHGIGHGIGLRICADLVANAAGMLSIADAVGQGHLGIDLVDQWFVAWFVWPSAEPLRAIA